MLTCFTPILACVGSKIFTNQNCSVTLYSLRCCAVVTANSANYYTAGVVELLIDIA